jgi:hypothetical protein
MGIKKLASIIFAALLIIYGCGKKSGQETTKTDDNKQQTTQQTQTVNQDSINKQQEADKQQKIKEAMDNEKIVNDTLGQWAIDADVSSTYGDEKATDKASGPYTKYQLLGKPDVEHYADDSRAWAPKEADKGIEWVMVGYDKAVNATEVRVRQNIGPGAIIKIELIDTDGKSHTVWEGPDKNKYTPDKIQYLFAKFDKTIYKTKRVKITLATNAVDGWNEIDAVQLVGQ